MSRFTRRNNDDIYVTANDGFLEYCYWKEQPLYKAFEKLVQYEDLEEQNRLLELPCAIGDVVYHIVSGEIKTGIVFRFDYLPYGDGCELGAYDIDGEFLGMFGVTCFTTRQEAEAKLAELKGAKE